MPGMCLPYLQQHVHSRSNKQTKTYESGSAGVVDGRYSGHVVPIAVWIGLSLGGSVSTELLAFLRRRMLPILPIPNLSGIPKASVPAMGKISEGGAQ
jgi:hypothetical protein